MGNKLSPVSGNANRLDIGLSPLSPRGARKRSNSAPWHRPCARWIGALLSVLLGLPAPLLAEDTSDLVDRGVAPALVYDGAGFTNLAGGLSRASTYSGNLNLRLTLGLDRLLDWPGATFYVDGLWIHGGQPSNIVGDAQGVSNISAPAAVQVEEIWLQKNFVDLPLSVLVGLYDLNSEFYHLQSADRFLTARLASARNSPSAAPPGLRSSPIPRSESALRTSRIRGLSCARRSSMACPSEDPTAQMPRFNPGMAPCSRPRSRSLSGRKRWPVRPTKGFDWGDSRCCHPMITSLRLASGTTPRPSTI